MNLCVEQSMVLLFFSQMFLPTTSHFHLTPLKLRVMDYLILYEVKYLEVWCMVNVMEFRDATISMASLSSLVHYL